MFFIVYSSNLCHVQVKFKPRAQSLHVVTFLRLEKVPNKSCILLQIMTLKCF